MRKIAKVIIFFIYTYIIANSLSFALMILLYAHFDTLSCWKIFVWTFCQWSLFGGFFDVPLKSSILLVSLAIVWDIVVLFYPVLLWWRTRTVFHAWLVATAGAFTTQYLPLYICKSHYHVFDALLLMMTGYAIAWLADRGSRQARQKHQGNPVGDHNQGVQ